MMARIVWVFVSVLFSIQQIFAIDCMSVNIQNIKNCDECIRCGALWCNQPKKGEPNCESERSDDWCMDHIEILPSITEKTLAGDLIQPKFRQNTVKVDMNHNAAFHYDMPLAQKPKVDVITLNSTQNDVEVTQRTHCVAGKCTTNVKFKIEPDFCSANGGTHEYFHVKLHVDNISEEATMMYHVPCACECSKNIEKNSKICNSRGDYSCGVCRCHEGWIGEFCEQKVQYECDRGDLQCTHPLKSEVECSGNGRCGKCDCICFDDREGSQYFDKEYYCSDICMSTNECDICLEDRPFGECTDCHYSLFTRAYNETLALERDNFGRKVWIKCEETLGDGCHVEYMASKNENNQIVVMKMNNCKPEAEAVAGAVNVTLPIVLGVIAIVAATVAAAGYMIWKNKDAPLPPASALYQELDGPKTRIEENPTYKSPTTSYNNPMWKQKV